MRWLRTSARWRVVWAMAAWCMAVACVGLWVGGAPWEAYFAMLLVIAVIADMSS